MKQEVKLTETLGKTLESVAFSGTNGQAVLVFTNGTFTTLGVKVDEYTNEQGGEQVVEDLLDWSNFWGAELIKVGVVTKEELQGLHDHWQKENRQQYEAGEKAEFERLKKKFEG